MARNRLTITHENDTIRLSWQRGQESTRLADGRRLGKVEIAMFYLNSEITEF